MRVRQWLRRVVRIKVSVSFRVHVWVVAGAQHTVWLLAVDGHSVLELCWHGGLC